MVRFRIRTNWTNSVSATHESARCSNADSTRTNGPSLERAFPAVSPANVKGIEINAYAAELAPGLGMDR